VEAAPRPGGSGERRGAACSVVRVRAGKAVCVHAAGSVPWLGAPRRGERAHAHAGARPGWARRGAQPRRGFGSGAHGAGQAES